MILSIIFIALVSTLSCYAIGCISIKVFKIEISNLFKTFYALVIGLSLITSVYALITTRGQTILAPLIFLVLSPIWFRRQSSELASVAFIEQKPTNLLSILIIPIGVIFFSLVLYTFNHDSVAGHVMTLSRDYVFYSKTSYALNIKHVESPFLNVLANGPLNPQPYHYLDLWVNALLVEILPIPSVTLLNGVVYSLMITIIFIGFAAVYEKFIARNMLLILLALLSVFTCATYISIFSYSVILQRFNILAGPTMMVVSPKVAPIFIFLLLGYCFLIDGRVIVASWIWSAMALVYTVVAPSAYLGGAFLIAYLFVRRRVSFSDACKAFSAYVVVALYIGAFYGLPSYLHPNELNFSLGYAQYLPALGDLRTVFNNFAGTLITIVVYYWPYLLLIGFLLLNNLRLAKRWTEYEPIFSSFLIFLVVATAIGAVFFRSTDGYQLGMVLALPTIVIGIVIVSGFFLQNKGIMPQIFTAVILGATLLCNLNSAVGTPYYFASRTKHDKNFVKKIANLSPKLSRYGAIILDRTEYDNVFSLNSDISTVGMYTSLVRDNTILLSLSVAELEHQSLKPFLPDTVFASYAIANAPLVQFMRKQEQGSTFNSIPETQRDFLIQNGINFICASPSAHLSIPLQRLVSLTLVDSVSKQKFYLLNVPLRPGSRPLQQQFVSHVW